MLQEKSDIKSRTSDAASMLKVGIKPNFQPYQRTIFEHNNKMVDQWKVDVLDKIADTHGKVRSCDIIPMWDCHFAGKNVVSLMDHYQKGLLPRPTEEMVGYWKNFFETATIEQMIELGYETVRQGWKVIAEENAVVKWEEYQDKVHKGVDDPLKWKEEYNKHPRIWNQDGASIFWDFDTLRDIEEKVHAVMTCGRPGIRQ